MVLIGINNNVLVILKVNFLLYFIDTHKFDYYNSKT